jgi:hypothetical protein
MGLRLRLPETHNFQIVDEVTLDRTKKRAIYDSLRKYYNPPPQKQQKDLMKSLNQILTPYHQQLKLDNGTPAGIFKYDFHEFIRQNHNSADQLKKKLASEINTFLNSRLKGRNTAAVRHAYTILNTSFEKEVKPALLKIIKEHDNSTIPQCEKKMGIEKSTVINFIRPLQWETIMYYAFWFFFAIICAINSRYIWNMIVQNAGKSDDEFKKVTGGISRRFYVSMYYILLFIILIVFVVIFLYSFERFRNSFFKFKAQDINKQIKLKNMNMNMDYLSRGANVNTAIDAAIATTIAAAATAAAKAGGNAEAVRQAAINAFNSAVDTINPAIPICRKATRAAHDIIARGETRQAAITAYTNAAVGNRTVIDPIIIRDIIGDIIDNNGTGDNAIGEFINHKYALAARTVEAGGGDDDDDDDDDDAADADTVAARIKTAADNATEGVWLENPWWSLFSHWIIGPLAIWILGILFVVLFSIQSILISHRASKIPNTPSDNFRKHTLIVCIWFSIILVVLISIMIYAYYKIVTLDYIQFFKCGRGY